MTGMGITNYVDLIRQTISGRSTVKPERKDTGDPTVEVFKIPSFKMREDIDLSTISPEDGGVPSRWTDGQLYENDINSPMGCKINREAFDRVREQLKSEGIDADSRTPAHEITDEQLDWLEARYDFDYLSVCSFEHTEFGNFMLDLAYLNVFSLDEVKDMCGAMPISADYQVVSLYYHGDSKTGDGAGYISLSGGNGEIIEKEDVQNEYIANYLKSKYANRTEDEYKEMVKKMADQMKDRLRIFEEIFKRYAENMGFAADGAFLKIEDASERLKEDFGGLM